MVARPGLRRALLSVALPAALALGLGDARAEVPLSAIDWLSQPVAVPPPDRTPDRPAAPTAGGSLLAEEIHVSPLDGPTTDALGLLPADRAGLPRDLWGMTPSAVLAERLAALGPDTLPALQELILALLLTELDPPADVTDRGALFRARLDLLRAFGALDQALALVEAANPDTPDLIARWFDLALLAGDVAPVCGRIAAVPDPALESGPDLTGALEEPLAARIYCAARSGDWDTADRLLESPEAAAMPEPLHRALSRFLDPEADHDPVPLPPPEVPSALIWQLADALGQAWPTATLPLAFAHADLSSQAGWKAQLEAAERLTRSGALTPNRLLGLYSERAPAASGGVWDRVRLMQRLETALETEDAAAVADLMPQIWAAMRAAELEVAFADLYAERLLALPLPPKAAGLAWRAGLITRAGAGIARDHPVPEGRDAFLAAIALGEIGPETPLPPGTMAAAIRDGLTAPPDDRAARLIAESRGAEVLLEALALLQGEGAADPVAVADALAGLRAVGQEGVARRAALQILLLDRRG